MVRRAALTAAILLCAACEGGLGSDARTSYSHTFPAVNVGAYEEVTALCQSWTIGNDEELWVNGVEMSAGPGWHHSNWMFVPDTRYEGADGTWPCAERDYDEVAAGTAGGVLFAQSTQSTGELQQFPAGAAFRVMDHARVVARIHLANASDTAIDTDITLTLHTLAEADVVTKLKPFVTTYFPLDLPPQAFSEFGASCDATGPNGDAPLDISIYYVLPHYHAWGRGYWLRATTPSGTVTIFDQDQVIGEAGGLGMVLDPPISLAGATSIEFGCRFHNNTDAPIGFGNSLEDEMCMMLAYSDDTRRWGGGVFEGPSVVTGTSGTGAITYTAPCGLVRF